MKYYYGNSYKEAVSNNPVEISDTKILEAYKDAYNVVIPAEEEKYYIVFKYQNDEQEITEEYYDFDDARADFEYMVEETPDEYQYVILQEVTYDDGEEVIDIIDEWEAE